MKVLIFIIIICFIGCSENKDSNHSSASNISISNLVVILDSIWIAEQEPIRLRDSIGRIFGFESNEFQKQQEICNKNHNINEKKILEILDNQGWPNRDIIGDQGNLTICNVLQHSDISVRIKYLPLMRKAVADKILQPRLLARAEDRIATDRGELQIYGGQIKFYPETKSFDVWPIFDPMNVDKRRDEIGLEPMKEFLNNRRTPMNWNLEEQIKRSEDFTTAKIEKQQD